MEKRGSGGAKRDRTADLLHAMQALSQLSYGPGTQGIDVRPQSLRVANHSSVAGRCGFILLQPHKIKIKIQSFLQF
jgi:hypothetical protein